MRSLFLFCGFYFVVASTGFSDPAPVSLPIPAAKQAAPISADTTLIMDRPGERDFILRQAHDDLYSGNFDDLENTEKTLRMSQSRFPEGLEKLGAFYDALSDPWETSETAWKTHLDKIAAWQKAKPDSLVAASAMASALVGYAWVARGDGYANTVTDEGWRLMKDRLAQARKILDDSYHAHNGKDIPPGWYSALQGVALGQGWSHQEYDRWFDEGVAAYPDYYDLYFHKAYYLLPRWYGQDGDAETFAEECGKKYGPSLYTRITWSLSSYHSDEDFFAQTHAKWDLMKTGFEDLEKKWPTSLWNLNAFCHFAYLAQDRPTAKRLFDKIGTHCYSNIWGSFENFQKARDWANGTAPFVQETPKPATEWETKTVIATDWSSWSIWLLPIVAMLSLLIGAAGMLIGIFAVCSRKP